MAIPPDFVSYSQGQAPGSYVFQRRDGSPIVLGGPTAERIAKELDQANPYGAGPPPTMPENRGLDNNPYQDHPGASLFSPGSQAIAQAAPAKPFDSAARIGGYAPPGAASPEDAAGVARVQPQAAPAQAAPQPGQGPAPKQFSTKGGRLIKTADGWQMVQSGGGGVSKAALEKQAGQGVLKSKSAETTQEGGYPMDPNYLPEMERVSNTRRVLNAQVADREAAGAAAEALRFAEDAAAAQKRAKLEARVAERAKQETARAEQEYDSAREEFRSSKIDPERYFRGDLGAFRKITSIIGQAFGAIGATIGRTQNFAQEIVQSRIEQDIAAQREDIRIRGQAADNALSQLTRKIGDQRAAESVLRSIQGDYAANLAKARAAATKRPEIMAIAQKWDLDEQQRQIQARKDYLQEVSGKVTQKVLGEFAYPTKGGASGARPLTIEEAKSLAELEGKQLGNEKTAQEVMNAEGGGDIDKQTRSEYATISSVKGDIERVAAEHGYAVDPTTGQLTEASPDAGFPSRGIGLVPGLPNSPANDKLRSDLVKIGRSTAGVLNPQGEPSPALVEANTPDASAPDSNIKARLESAYQMALERERALSAGAKPQDLRTLEQRRTNVTVQQNQRPSAPRARKTAQ